MKKFLLATLSIFLLCGCEALDECVKHTGNTATLEYAVDPFYGIVVHRGIGMVITQADTFSVKVVTGENLIDDIKVVVKDGILVLSDDTSCNWVRDYGQTVVYVTAPTLSQIESKTELDIDSGNLLTYPTLTLIAVDLSNGAGTNDFHIQVDSEKLEVQSNNVAAFYLSGETDHLVASFYEGNGVIKAQNLIAQQIDVFHRGSNNMYLHPVQSIAGNLYSTGNVFCSPQPPIVNVVRHYHGQLIFE